MVPLKLIAMDGPCRSAELTPPQEVALSTLYVSSKLHDTLKKPRELILASYAIRFPQLVKKGAVDPAAIDPNVLEGERKRVLSIERLVLETMCFRFGVQSGLGVVIKLGKALGGMCGALSELITVNVAVDKETIQRSWRVAVDW
jgi:CTD kinase subunit beta